MRPLVSQAAWVTLLTTLLMLPAHAVDVRAIRLWAGPDSTRVVLLPPKGDGAQRNRGREIGRSGSNGKSRYKIEGECAKAF